MSLATPRPASSRQILLQPLHGPASARTALSVSKRSHRNMHNLLQTLQASQLLELKSRLPVTQLQQLKNNAVYLVDPLPGTAAAGSEPTATATPKAHPPRPEAVKNNAAVKTDGPPQQSPQKPKPQVLLTKTAVTAAVPPPPPPIPVPKRAMATKSKGAAAAQAPAPPPAAAANASRFLPLTAAPNANVVDIYVQIGLDVQSRKFLVNPRSAYSLELLYDNLSALLRVSGGVRRLLTLDGQQIESVQQLYSVNTLIAVGPEKIDRSIFARVQARSQSAAAAASPAGVAASPSHAPAAKGAAGKHALPISMPSAIASAQKLTPSPSRATVGLGKTPPPATKSPAAANASLAVVTRASQRGDMQAAAGVIGLSKPPAPVLPRVRSPAAKRYSRANVAELAASPAPPNPPPKAVSPAATVNVGHVDYLVAHADGVAAKAAQERRRQQMSIKRKMAARQKKTAVVVDAEEADAQLEVALSEERKRQQHALEARLKERQTAKAPATVADVPASPAPSAPSHAKKPQTPAAKEAAKGAASTKSKAQPSPNPTTTAAAEPTPTSTVTPSSPAPKPKKPPRKKSQAASTSEPLAAAAAASTPPAKPTPPAPATSLVFSNRQTYLTVKILFLWKPPLSRYLSSLSNGQRFYVAAVMLQRRLKVAIRRRRALVAQQAELAAHSQPAASTTAQLAFRDAKRMSVPTPDLEISPSTLMQVQDSAATRIQAAYRGMQVRKSIKRKDTPGQRTEAAEAAPAMVSAIKSASAPAVAPLEFRTEPDSGHNLALSALASNAPASALNPSSSATSLTRAASKLARFSTAREPAPGSYSPYGIMTEEQIKSVLKFHEKLGDGNFAEVLRATEIESGEEYAIKAIDKAKIAGQREQELLRSEIAMMRQIVHPNCIELYDVFETPKHIYLLMELVRGGDLFDYIVKRGKLKEMEAACLIADLASAVAYMHKHNIVHRDLKPENILVAEGPDGSRDMLKLGDFGLSMPVDKPLYTICGTPTYVAPEILGEGDAGYGLEVDNWAMGIILYILLCGFPPFSSSSKNQKELFNRIRKGHFTFPAAYWDAISAEAKDLVKRLLMVEAGQRATAEDVLSDVWVRKGRRSEEEAMRTRRLTAKKKWLQAAKKLLLVTGGDGSMWNGAGI